MRMTIIYPRLHTIGGSSKLMVEAAIELASRGHLIQLLCGKCHPYWHEKLRGNKGIFIEELGIRFDNPVSWLMSLELSRKLSMMIDNSSQVVIASSFPAWIASSMIPRDGKIIISYLQDAPPVLHDCDAWDKLPMYLRLFYKSMSRLYGEVDRQALISSDLIITNSQLSVKHNSKAYGVEYNRIKVVYPGIDVKTFDRGKSIPDVLQERKRNIIFLPNGASSWRRPEITLKAIQSLNNVLAVFTSASTLELRRVAQLAKKLNIREKVVCLPQLLEPEMKYMYSIASVVVSIAYRESFGLTALEALVMGVPVIISQTSGVSEILQHRVHALHVSPDDYVKLASHIEELLTNSQLAEKIARNGRSKVLNGFTIQNFVSSLIKEIILFQR